MAQFRYKVRDSRGRIQQGTLSARNKAEAKTKILRRGLQLLALSPEANNSSLDDAEFTPLLGSWVYRDAAGKIQISLSSPQPSAKELILFTKQFATMLNSGVPMIQGLNVLAKQQTTPSFARALRRVRFLIEGGSTLSAALATFPRIFDSLYVAMVEAGEASGNLDRILTRLVSYIEKAEKIKGQLKSAMAYPSIVVAVALAVIAGLLAFVVPVFAQQFTDTGRELPGLTQMVITASEHFTAHWYVYLGLALALTLGLRLLLKSPQGRQAFDAYILQAPVLGGLLKKIAVGRFCSTLASMLSSGVNLLAALSICAASSGNKKMEAFILSLRAELEKGQSLSQALSGGGLIPEIVVSMVKVGEASGALDEMLNKVSDFYEEEVDQAVQTLVSMIEPLMIVVIGGLVGFIVIAMYLPVFELAGGVG